MAQRVPEADAEDGHRYDGLEPRQRFLSGRQDCGEGVQGAAARGAGGTVEEAAEH